MADTKQELDPALVERACIAQEGGPELWDLTYPSGKVVRRAAMTRALLSLGIPATALNALWRGDAVVVPKAPTGDMVEIHQFECAGDADEAGPARIRAAWAAMLAASPYWE